MGRVLAGLLNAAFDARVTDDADREAVIVEATAPDGVDREQLDALLSAETVTLPAEATVRVLLEAAGVENTDAAINGARNDGDVFEGDEISEPSLPEFAGGRLVEAVGDGATPGTKRFQVVVIRPGRAQGPGRRYYPPKMLEANAAHFGDQPVFFNHEDLPTILNRGHGSRDPRDLAGYLIEATWWDPNYTEPDDKKNGRKKGAVMGHADLLVEAAKYVESLPKAVALSVCMDPTDVKVGRTDDGELAPIVEGVIPKSGSLDLITGKAGAGGKVLQRLREAAEARYGSGHEDLGALDDDRLIEAVRERPGLLERLREDNPLEPPEDLSVEPDKIIEALGDPEAADKIAAALASTPTFVRIIEARVSEREDSIREEVEADGQRRLDLRDLRDEAHRLIEAAGRDKGGILPPSFVEDLRERYMLREGHPTPALDVYPKLTEAGAVETPQLEVLVEAVKADITREEAKVREAAPTMVSELAAPLVEGEQKLDDDGNPIVPEPPKDPLAEDLGLDSERVREYQKA